MGKRRFSRAEWRNIELSAVMEAAVDGDPPDHELARRAIGLGFDLNSVDPDDPTRESF